MYFTKSYAEPKIDYEKQLAYWSNQKYNMKSMAHSQKFSKLDK